jgi:hypothetical protein
MFSPLRIHVSCFQILMPAVRCFQKAAFIVQSKPFKMELFKAFGDVKASVAN